MSRLLTLGMLIGWAAMTISARPLLAADQVQDAVIAPFLSDQTFAVAAIDLTAPGNDRLAPYVIELAGDADQGEHEIGQTLGELLLRLAPAGAGAENPSQPRLPPLDQGRTAYLVANCSDVFGAFTYSRPAQGSLGQSLFLVLPGLKPETIQKIGKDMAESPGNQSAWTCREIKACAVLAEPKLLERLAGLKPTARPDLAAALAAAGQRPVRIALAPPPLFARAAGEILKSPAPGTAAPLGESLAGFRWAALGMNVNQDRPGGELVVQAGSGDDARRLAQLVQGAGAALAGIDPAAAKVDGDRATWTLDKMLQEKVGQAVERFAVREAIHADMRRLKDIGISLHNFHDVHKHFPDVAIRDAKGEPLLSWRVAILPYLDGGPALYKQFHLDEPWDSEHNRKLIDQMPDLFRSVQTPPGRTRFLAPVGESLAFTTEKGGLNIKSFSDGTSKTIMLVEADTDHAVVWTKPEDLPIDLENPKRGITDGTGAFATAFADASAHRIAGSVDPEVLRKFLTRNGGEGSNVEDLYPAQ